MKAGVLRTRDGAVHIYINHLRSLSTHYPHRNKDDAPLPHTETSSQFVRKNCKVLTYL